MKKLTFIIFFISFMIFGCGREEKDIPSSATTLHIDLKKTEKYMDLSEYIDTSYFKAIPLETTAECLVGGEIRKVFYRNGRLYVWEEQTRSVFMFDENGKYIAKINNQGEGPREYLGIKDVMMSDSLICIFDAFGRKVLYYDLDCNFIRSISSKHVYDSIITAAHSFMVGDRIYFGLHFRENFRTDLYGAPHKWVSMDLDLNKKSVKRFLPYDYSCPTEAESHFSIDYPPYSLLDGKVRFMVSNLDTIFVATRDTIVPEYILDFGEQSLPVRLYKSTYQEEKNNEEFDNYMSGIWRMLDSEDYLILYFRYGDYSLKEILASLPAEIRDNYKKRSEWLNRNRPTTEYYLFINKKTGEHRLTNGIFFEMISRHPSIKIADGKYLIEPRNNSPFGFKEDGSHSNVLVPGNPRLEKYLNEVYSTVRMEDNPVLFIYKFKDAE